MDPTSLKTVFYKKYTEFCTDLEGACPELKAQITAAAALNSEVRWKRFCNEVNASPQRDPEACPGCVLPGVTIPKSLWRDLSLNTQKAIQEYLTLMSLCSMYENTANAMDLSGQADFMKGFLDQVKEKLAGTDFKKLSETFATMFAATSASAAGEGAGIPGLGAMPNLPQKFLKGKIAQLAEELVHEFRAEDFGLTEAQLLACEKDPTQAFALLMEAYTGRPEMLQNAMKKIGTRMQQKIARGELRPQDLAAEAEELIKECTDNPAFKEMLESMRSVFGFEDMDMARAQGREGSARLSLARNRLRAKLEKRKAGGGGGGKK
jgi:hypothetical protein